MRTSHQIPVDLAHESFSYDEEVGALIWRFRPLSHFHDESYQKRWNARFAGKRAGCLKSSGDGRNYHRIYFAGRFFHAHRIIWAMHHGDIPAGKHIDHVDGDGTNNRLANLRVVSPTGNNANMKLRRDNKSGRVGVRFYEQSKKWRAEGCVNGKAVRLGHYATFDEAVAARRDWERENQFHQNHGAKRC